MTKLKSIPRLLPGRAEHTKWCAYTEKEPQKCNCGASDFNFALDECGEREEELDLEFFAVCR